MDYSTIPTPSVCVADFCLIPVSFPRPVVPCLNLLVRSKAWNLSNNLESRLVRLLPQFRVRSLLSSAWWKQVDLTIQCTVQARLLVRRQPFCLSSFPFSISVTVFCNVLAPRSMGFRPSLAPEVLWKLCWSLVSFSNGMIFLVPSRHQNKWKHQFWLSSSQKDLGMQ